MQKKERKTTTTKSREILVAHSFSLVGKREFKKKLKVYIFTFGTSKCSKF